MLWIISTMIFLLLRIAPGDPVDAILGSRANESARLILRERLGLNQPIINQYFEYMKNLFNFDLGESLNTQINVKDIIFNSLPATFELIFFSLIIAIFIGILFSSLVIISKSSKLKIFSKFYGIGTYALPPFWAAMIIQVIFAINLGWFPIGGRFPPYLEAPQGTGFYVIDSIITGNWISLLNSIKHLFLPSITLGILLSGIFSRSIITNLGKTLESDYVEAAKSRGLDFKRILIKYALPNALLPLITITGLTIASLIGGALLIEVTFSWPGIALSLQEAINQRDYPVVQGITIVIAAIVVTISIFVDLIIALIDPRIKF